jgi:hypothetical protein
MTFRLGEEFDKALKQVLSVSKDDLKRMLEEEKKANVGKPKRGPKPKISSELGHASDRTV